MGVVHSEIYDLGSRPCDADAACERGKHLTFSCEIDERDETRIVGTGALPDDAHYLLDYERFRTLELAVKEIRRLGVPGATAELGVFRGVCSRLIHAQMQRLLDMNLDSIKFSFQGADEGTYNEMREGGDYERLLGIVQRFHELRGDRAYPFIQISTTLTGETAEQVAQFKHDIGAFCDYYNIGYTKLTHLNVDAMHIDATEKEKIRKLQQQESIRKTYRKNCPEAFDKLSINWNGDVTLCCMDYDNFMIVGNILDHDIKEIFNARATEVYRKAILAGELGKIKCCSTCFETVPLTK